MSQPEELPHTLFPYERFRFTIKVASLMVLPPYKGAVFRGAFGNAFRRVVCAIQRTNCSSCLLQQKCLYVAIFEPPPPANYPDAAKFSDAPRPFVLNPPLTNRQAFHPGDNLEFELVLIGPAIEALPYFIYTFVELGRKGLGTERGRYGLVAVDLLRGEDTIRIYNGKTQTLTSYPPKKNGFESRPEDRLAGSITLNFLTPLRLKVKGDLVTRLTFPLFFDRLAQRLTLLAAFYNSTTLPDFSPLLTLAQSIDVTAHELHWYEWERYSVRQQESMKFGGLRGSISLSGDLVPLMPYLRLGEGVNIGQSTTFGLGKYKIDRTYEY